MNLKLFGLGLGWQTLGVALVGAIVTSHLGGWAAATLATAIRPAWWTLTAASAAVLALGFLATGRRAHASARVTAAALNPEALVE